MPDLDSFVARHGAELNSGADRAALDALQAEFAGVPAELLAMLTRFDGERLSGSLLPHGRVNGVDQIREMAGTFRELIEQDDALPPVFAAFIPIIATEVKSDVGVMATSSSWKPGAVVELHIGSGGFLVRAESFAEFLASLLAARATGAGNAEIGTAFPPEGAELFETWDFDPDA